MIEFNKQYEWNCLISYSITMSCNNRCSYCSVLHALDNTLLFDREMTDKVIEKVIEFKEKNPEYHLRVQFKGGEPLLVIDEIIDFMEKTKGDNVEFLILSNFNFKPKGSKIQRILEYYEKPDRAKFSILVTAHESSDINFVKQNLLDLRHVAENKFLVENNNIDYVYEFAKWCVENNIDYSFKDIRSSHAGYKANTIKNFLDKKMKYILDNSDEYSGDVTWNDERIPAQQAKQMDLKNVAKKYWTICKLASFSVGYNGVIQSGSCGVPYRRTVDQGFEVKEFLCNGYECYCSTDDYKKLLRERDAKV